MDFHNNGQSTRHCRVSEAVPNLRLPFTAASPAPTLMALDHAVFEGRYTGSTADLVDADDAVDGNRGFALHGDVASAALGYHLWALALVMGTDYREKTGLSPWVLLQLLRGGIGPGERNCFKKIDAIRLAASRTSPRCCGEPTYYTDLGEIYWGRF